MKLHLNKQYIERIATHMSDIRKRQRSVKVRIIKYIENAYTFEAIIYMQSICFGVS